MDRSARQDHRRQGAVGAAVDDELDVHREQASVAIDGRSMAGPGRMPFRRGRHVFRTVVEELHRAAGLPGEQRGMPGDDRRILLLAAESSAGLHLHHTDFFRGDVEQTNQRLVDVVGALHRTPDGDARFGIGNREHAVRLDVELLLRTRLVLAFHDRRRVAKCLIDITARDQIRLEQVVLTPNYRARRQRLLDLEHGRQRFDVDGDVTSTKLHHLTIGMCQQHDRFFGMIYAIARKVGLIVDDQRDAIRSWNIGGRDHRELVPRHAGLVTDVPDDSPRHRAADSRAEHHPRQRHVVHIPCAAGDLCLSLFSWDRPPERLRHPGQGSTPSEVVSR